MATAEETRKQILKAAQVRFLQYGFNKTTMNEIAEDCRMSAANIYRFFKSKNEIVAEMAIQFFKETEDQLRKVVQQPGLTAIERLEVFTFEMLKTNFELFDNQLKIREIIDFVSSERFDLVEIHEDKKRALIAEILAEGNRSGEFAVDDIVTAADIVLKATILVHCPVLMDFYSFEEMEYFAKEIVQLMVRGLGR